MAWLVKSIQDFCLAQGFDNTYWIGYSGGLDSHVLLHLIASQRMLYPIKIRVVHINHGLSPNAQNWAVHCASVCKQLEVDFISQTIFIPPNTAKSIEELAREGRYKVFSELLVKNDVLLTAHHQDDQAETVLLQMLRGAGPKGLAAMPRKKILAKGFHIRPLLDFSRNDLQAYAEENQLKWIDDESNHNSNFTRNFLRHEILPLLKNRWPSVSATLSRVAENCAETQQLLDETVKKDLEFVLHSEDSLLSQQDQQENAPAILSIKKLTQLDSVRQRHVLRAWLNQLNFPIPPAVKLQQIQRDMLQAREDKMPHFAWSGIELRRYQNHLYAMRSLPPHDVTQVYDWDFSQPLVLPNIGTLRAEHCLEKTLQKVSVRFRQGGETLQLPDKAFHQSLKNLFQEWGVPPWERDRVPLIYIDKQLAAVVGYAVSSKFLDVIPSSIAVLPP